MKEEISENDIRDALIRQLHESAKKEKVKRKRKVSEIKAGGREDAKKEKKHNKSQKQTTEVILQTSSDLQKGAPQQQKQNVNRPFRPPPKVIVFNEPGKTDGKKTQHDRFSKKQKSNDEASSEDDDDEFISLAKEVQDFGMTGFSKKERRKFEQEKAQSLGAKAPKGMKMPYKILLSVNKVKKQREKKKEALERAMGMSVKKKSGKKEEDKPVKGSGWWADNSSKGFDMALGKYKKGVQRISKDDIKRVRGARR